MQFWGQIPLLFRWYFRPYTTVFEIFRSVFRAFLFVFQRRQVYVNDQEDQQNWLSRKKNFDSEIPWRWYLRFTISGIWISNTTVRVFQNQTFFFLLNQFAWSSWSFTYTWRLWNTNKSALNTGIWISNTTDGGIWISNTTVMVFQNQNFFFFSLINSLGHPEHLCILGASEIPIKVL